MLFIKSKSIKTELYRKAIHLSSLWIALFIYIVPIDFCMITFLILFLGNLYIEYAAFHKTSHIGTLFRKMFFKTFRNKEIYTKKFIPSGSVYVLAAALIVSVCYTTKAAAIAMAIMIVSDSCAALIGKTFGKIRFYNKKTLEGTFAFWLSAFLIIMAFCSVSVITAFIIAAVTTMTEFFEKELRIDDNLAIPVISGFLLNLITAL